MTPGPERPTPAERDPALAARLAAWRERAEALVSRFSAALARDPAGDRAALLHYERARLLELPLGRSEEAASDYLTAAAGLDDHLPSLRGLARCALRLGRTADALEALAHEASLTPDPETRGALLAHRARLIPDPAAALAAWHASVAAAPSVSALRGLAAAAAAARDPEAQDAALSRLSPLLAADPAARATVLVARARLAEAAARPDAAIALYQQALALDPTAPGAGHALTRLLPVVGRWRELADTLEAELRRTPEPAAATPLFLALARLHEEALGDPDAAAAVLARAFALTPQSAPVLDELARHHERTGRWAALADVLERRAHLATDRGERVALWHRLARLCRGPLAAPAAAVRWLQAALSLEPAHGPALADLGALLAAAGDWPGAIEALLREADVSLAPERRADACTRAGALAERHLDDLPFAIAQHERALALWPGHAAAFAALDRLYVATGRFDALVALHEGAAERATTPADAVASLFAVATVYETRLAAPGLAAGVFRRILALAPERVDALHGLQRVAERAGRPRELLDALDLELARDPAPARAAALELRAALALADGLDEPERAVLRARRAVALEPGHPAAWALLERLLRQLGRAAELVQALESGLDLEPAGPAAVARLSELAALAGGPLAEPHAAVGYLERALSQAPGDRALRDALALALGRVGRSARRLEIEALRVEAQEDPEARAHAAWDLGRLAEAEGELAVAAQAYRDALAARPDWRPARDALARLADRPEAHRFVLAAFETERALAQDPERRRQAGHAAAQLAHDRLADPTRARALLDRLAEEGPADRAALLERERAARADGDVEALRGALAGLGASPDPGLAAAALRELAWREVQDGRGDARATLRQLVQRAPRDREGLLVLERLALDEGDAVLLERVEAAIVDADAAAPQGGAQGRERRLRLAELRAAIRPAGAIAGWEAALEAFPESRVAAWEALEAARAGASEALEVRALAQLAALSRDPEEVASVLVARAGLLAGRLGDRAGAFAALEEALALAPDHVEAARAVEALAGAHGEVALGVAMLSRAGRIAREPARVHALWERVGRWCVDALGQRAEAVAAYGRALAARPEDGALWARQAELYARGAQFAEAARCYEEAARRAADAEGRRAAQRALAVLWAERLGEPERARALLAEVAAGAAEDRVTLRALYAAHRAAGAWSEAVEAARRLVARLEDAAERVALQHEVAELLERRGEAAAAFAVRLEIVAAEGAAGSAAAACRRGLASVAEGEAYLGALLRWAEGHPSAVDAAFQREVAQVRGVVLGRPDEALRWLAEAVVAQPADLALQEVLVEALVAAGAVEEAVEAAQNLVQVDVARASSWRTLHAASREAGRTELAARALAPLCLRGEATAAEAAAAVVSGGGLGPARPLTAEALRRIGEERAGTRAAERLLAALGDLAGRAFPERLDALHVGELSRLVEGDSHALWGAAEQVAARFGIGHFELLLDPDPAATVRAVPTSPPAVLVPLSLLEAAPAARSYALARAFAKVTRGLEALDVLDDGALALLLAGAVRLVESDAPVPASSTPAAVDELARRLGRLMPRRGRGPVDEAAAALAREGLVDVRAWRRAVAVTSARAALLVSDDLGAALAALAREPQPGLDLARDALVFWTSDAAERAR